MPALKLVQAPVSGEIGTHPSDAPSATAPRPNGEPHSSPLHVVALLVIDRESEAFANLKSPHGASDIYIGCAALLAKSAHAAGYEITLFTNEEALVRRHFDALDVVGSVRIEQRAFVSRLDRSVQHRSAHHKLDVIRELAQGDDGRTSMLVDLDAVFLRPLRLGELPNARQIGCYDISGAMRAESAGRSDDDIRHLTQRFRDGSPRWFGGEAIAGNAAKFREFLEYLDEVEPRYWELRDRLYHTGDEAPVSSALNLYLAKGGAISEMGDRRTIARWWTAGRPFRQPDFSAVVDRAILHLPADKEFLASMASDAFDPRTFIAAYRRYARVKLFGRRIKSLLFDRLRRGQPNFVARL